ncbi:PD-(D/E)XK motif protein [Glutamicibacter soli]
MTANYSESIRRIDPETIERYFRSPGTVVHLLSNEPRCELRIDPLMGSLELRVPNDNSKPDLGNLENIEFVYLTEDDKYSISLAASGMHYAAYSFIAQIVDQLRNGQLLSSAIAQSIGEHETLLQSRRVLSPEKQTGLIGELLLFNYLARIDPDSAMMAWLGPEAEQHDFSFRAFDLEVKTTKSENRTHRIGSATQLEPSANRELWFLSVQITSAGAANNGFSLVDLVEQARDSIGPLAPQFAGYLTRLGWRDADMKSYLTRYVLRSVPAFYRVDDRFPSLRNSVLGEKIPLYRYISDVSYRTDISHLSTYETPNSLIGFVPYISSNFGGFNVGE